MKKAMMTLAMVAVVGCDACNFALQSFGFGIFDTFGEFVADLALGFVVPR
jgi:hypothetical protein